MNVLSLATGCVTEGKCQTRLGLSIIKTAEQWWDSPGWQCQNRQFGQRFSRFPVPICFSDR
jgi:hypothetical protein